MTDEKNSKTPTAASDKEPAVPTGDEPTYELMAFAHLIAAAPGRYFENTQLKSEICEVSSPLGLYHFAAISLITSRVREDACGGNGADGYYCTGGASG